MVWSIFSRPWFFAIEKAIISTVTSILLLSLFQTRWTTGTAASTATCPSSTSRHAGVTAKSLTRTSSWWNTETYLLCDRIKSSLTETAFLVKIFHSALPLLGRVQAVVLSDAKCVWLYSELNWVVRLWVDCAMPKKWIILPCRQESPLAVKNASQRCSVAWCSARYGRVCNVWTLPRVI